MPIVITIAGGRLKREIVEMAREQCGQAGFEFEVTPEEVSADVRLLDVLMAEWPYSQMGYNTDTPSLPEDESGLSDVDVMAVATALAARRMAQSGRAMPATFRATAARAYASACSRYPTMPTMPLAPHSVLGSGTCRTTPFVTESLEE